MLSRIPVGGVAWLVGQYARGFELLGFETYYVEAHSRTPSMFMDNAQDRNVRRAFERAADFVGDAMKRFGLGDRWALQALQDQEQCFGLSQTELAHLFRDAALIINMHGGTLPLSEHAETGRLIYLGTDPVELEIELEDGYQPARDFMAAHNAHFTWALNYGNRDCELPWFEEFPMLPSPPPVIVDFWESDGPRDDAPFTTIGNWRQDWRDITFRGEVYRWSKHHEFLKVLELPSRITSGLELALGCYDEEDERLLESNGWRVRPAAALSRDISQYRDYILASRGEFTVAKEQNVRLRTGWFSERSATYLAAGRPVVVQDTGFGNALPIGEGLFAFGGLEDAADQMQEVAADYERHSKAAKEIARTHFSHEVVLGDILDHVGVAAPNGRTRPVRPPSDLPGSLALTPCSRHPLTLPSETLEAVLARPVPAFAPTRTQPKASVVIVSLNNIALTRMAIESVMINTADISYEVIVVDNGSSDWTGVYLSVLAAKNKNVTVVRNGENRGFAAACNQGMKIARGEVVVLLNNDTIVPPHWLSGLTHHLEDPSIGLVGPVTNRCGNEAEVLSPYGTYATMLEFAGERRAGIAPRVVDIPVAVMFCVGLRRDTLERVGFLDERYELGMFEDDDYAHRVRRAGNRVVCAEDVFVHHFGEGSLGWLAAAGRYGAIFEGNRRRFELKWGTEWTPHGRRHQPGYDQLRSSVRGAVAATVPPGSVVLVVSRGDDLLLDLPHREGWHFLRSADGRYAGYHPADDAEAIEHLEELRRHGATFLVVPAPGLWWLDYYRGFGRHLDRRYTCRLNDRSAAVIYDLRQGGGE
jgi:GT2 family glycosyltransferase